MLRELRGASLHGDLWWHHAPQVPEMLLPRRCACDAHRPVACMVGWGGHFSKKTCCTKEKWRVGGVRVPACLAQNLLKRGKISGSSMLAPGLGFQILNPAGKAMCRQTPEPQTSAQERPASPTEQAAHIIKGARVVIHELEG